MTGRAWQPLMCLVFVLAPACSGCMSFLHPVEPAKIDQSAECLTLPVGCREHVYVFFVHGMDPLDYANLTGVRNYVQELGFHKTYYGQMYSAGQFGREIRRIREADPEARFVLIGFSFGANFVRDLTISAGKENIPIDLLVYLGGNTLENRPQDQPENAARIINILASGLIWNGDTLDRAENLQEPDVWHFGTATHPHTLNLLAHELATVAARVTYVERSVPIATIDPEPTPRPIPAPMSTKADEWDFLKPESHLDMVKPIGTRLP
jgi:hypothetical protein